jgi:integral membrane protein
MKRNPVPLLRRVAIIEAISFLLLVLVAMPLKYLADLPMAVKIVGMIHGVLFVAFVGLWLWTIIAARWGFGRSALVMVSALLPAGPFVIDRRMKGYEREFAERHNAPATAAV